MAISSTTRKSETFIGDGVSTEFPFTFRVIGAEDISVVTKNTATKIESVLVLDSDYSVTVNPRQSESPGGIVTLFSALQDGSELVIYSEIIPVSMFDVENLGSFNPIAITQEFDKLYMIAQQLNENDARAIKVSVFDDESAIPLLVQGVSVLAERIDDITALAYHVADISTVAGMSAELPTIAGYADSAEDSALSASGSASEAVAIYSSVVSAQASANAILGVGIGSAYTDANGHLIMTYLEGAVTDLSISGSGHLTITY